MNKELIQTQFVPVKNDEKGVGINKKLLKKLKKIGNIDSTISDVIEDILNHCDECDRFVENRT